MIYGDFQDWERDRIGLSPRLAAVLEWLNRTPLEDWDNGSYPLPVWSGEALLILKYARLQPAEEVRFEHHQRHIDIHYCISGEEGIGYARDSGNHTEVVMEPPIEDHTFFEQIDDSLRLLLRPGMYAVFFPGDLHRPCCATSLAKQVRKAIVKLPI